MLLHTLNRSRRVFKVSNKHKNRVIGLGLNMLKVSKEETTISIDVVLISLLLTWNIFNTTLR